MRNDRLTHMKDIFIRSISKRRNYFKLVWVDPKSVKYCTKFVSGVNCSRNEGPNYVHYSDLNRGYFPVGEIGNYYGGMWDDFEIKIESMSEYKALREFIVEKKAWYDTNFSKEIELLFLNGENSYGFKSLSEYKEFREADLIGLVGNVRKYGLLPSSTNPLSRRYFDNVQLNQGRDGSYFFNGGFHRFCVSRILGVNKIPAVIVARHVLCDERC